MQGSLWVKLLRRIPAELHNSLALGLVTGDEVVVQQLIRLDSDFIIVRGRMSGSTAEGRVMLVPYAQMTMVAVNKQLPEAEVQGMFGQAAPSATAPPPSPPVANPPVDNQSPNPPRVEIASAASQLKAPSKSVLLARLRERLAEKAK